MNNFEQVTRCQSVPVWDPCTEEGLGVGDSYLAVFEFEFPNCV